MEFDQPIFRITRPGTPNTKLSGGDVFHDRRIGADDRSFPYTHLGCHRGVRTHVDIVFEYAKAIYRRVRSQQAVLSQLRVMTNGGVVVELGSKSQARIVRNAGKGVDEDARGQGGRCCDVSLRVDQRQELGSFFPQGGNRSAAGRHAADRQDESVLFVGLIGLRVAEDALVDVSPRGNSLVLAEKALQSVRFTLEELRQQAGNFPAESSRTDDDDFCFDGHQMDDPPSTVRTWPVM